MRVTDPSGKRMSSAILLDVLEVEPMASGHKSLRITRSVSWAGFEAHAEALVRVLNGQVVHRADSPAERVWSVEIGGCQYWLSFDDFGLGVSLDSCDAAADAHLEVIHSRLRDMAAGQEGQS